MFIGISSFGAILQLLFVYLFTELVNLQYEQSLILAIIITSANNFILNKRITFVQKIWG